MDSPLTTEQIEQALSQLPGWVFQAQKLSKTFRFQTFSEAVSFIVRLAFEAEAQNHHPEICNVYNRVEISLTTHDAGNQVTRRDLQLAEAIERFIWV
jgi:4a-hydroxytetrahydrobiopterin dehydratase